MTQPQGSARGLAHGRERLGQQRVEAFPVLIAFLEPTGFLSQLGVGHRTELIGELVDGVRVSAELLQSSAFSCAQKLLEENSHFSPYRQDRMEECRVGE